MLGALLGAGNTADVFDADADRVIKLFHAGYPEDAVRKELANSRLIDNLDIPIARSHGLISWNGRWGIVYDKIAGPSLLDLLLRSYDVEQPSMVLAQMHSQLLSQNLPPAIRLKSILQRGIESADELSSQSKSRLREILNGLPEGDRFCHGDFHFGNVLSTQRGYYVIDYMNVCCGHEYGDIARTVYLIEMTPVPAETRDRERLLSMKRTATDIYLRAMGVDRGCLADWLTVTAAARLFELTDRQEQERAAVLRHLARQGI